MTTQTPLHNCFVISPIGEKNSEIRNYADKVLTYIIKRSLEPIGCKVTRADEISEPGTINLQVIRRIVEAEVVVADLTGHNPNVMYELAIRHAIKKPVILMIKAGERIPFDIATERTIIFDISDIESVDRSRENLAEQAGYILSNQFKIDTPFSLIEGFSSTQDLKRDEIDNWTIALDDIGSIKSIVKKILDVQTEVEVSRLYNLSAPRSLPSNNWVKIRIEFSGTKGNIRSETLEISSEQTIQDVLNQIFFILRDNHQSSFHPQPYTYLWDWILTRKKDGAPFVIKGFQSQILGSQIFLDGETWQVQKLDEPLLNNTERFGITKGWDLNW